MLTAPFWWPLVASLATAISAAIIRRIEKRHDRKAWEKEKEEEEKADTVRGYAKPKDRKGL